MLFHIRSLEPEDDPQTLPSSISPICLMSADGGQVWHDLLSHLAPRDSRAALYGVKSDFLFVFLLPPLNLHACISSGQLLQLSFERLPLLIAPSVDPHLNSARHCDAQVDASCGCKHKQAKK